MAIRSNLIGTEELHSIMDQNELCIVDCRFDLSDPLAGVRAYHAEHIRGAVFADLDKDLAAPISDDSGRHPLPNPDTLAATLERLGISNDVEIVVYDGNTGALAARAWWLLRWLGHEQVRLLDGGLAKWKFESRPLAHGEEPVEAGSFSPRPDFAKVLTTAEIVEHFGAIADMKLLDARDAARFRGEFEPIDPIAGHIPGTYNLPYAVSLDENGTWKSQRDLEALWLDVLGKQKETAWAVMCGSGVTACHLAISGMEAGYREPRLYVGSWSEWIRDPERPIGAGEGRNTRPKAADLA